MSDYLKSDCSNCFGLCCVALPYAKSADFAFNKDGGKPCRHLCTDNRCSIHDDLRGKGFRGCVSYECFGAGQHVSQTIFKGKEWRAHPEAANLMFSVFPIVQQLHEMLYYLRQAMNVEETSSLHSNLKTIYEETLQLTNALPEEILQFEIAVHRSIVNEYLTKTSELVRKETIEKNKNMKELQRADYIGARLKKANLKGANLRGKLFIAADLSYADLRKADFIGADLRDADLRNANLTECIFLTQSQVNSARGNRETKLPDYVERPQHWLDRLAM
ncbi:pentapeptide repeat-containing protein [Cytobacillus purgationiresistens]|uniref:Uncharacterized protein YjbI with pentapeptide repeats n=1 Tax=Cytobacillus purgationiresistens TaxID=863449 RepID=A0ABU0ALZ3_9BACI|nr:pentapeptide repeat-containing protein [Cytobacillus purgationiresistens]MDQ0272292.1 uncharacterized protein YjbI with pentapeptide repeats [Cytobacillus purgationiresistens]